MSPTEAGLRAITPAPMTSDEIADLVERVRGTTIDAARRSIDSMRRRRPMSRERLARARSERAAAREQARAHARSLCVGGRQ